MKHVNFINVVKYDELSVRRLYKDFLNLTGMKLYFPDTYPKGRQCDRDYMFNVANTLHEHIVKEIVEHALTIRHSLTSKKKKEEAILMTEDSFLLYQAMNL